MEFNSSIIALALKPLHWHDFIYGCLHCDFKLYGNATHLLQAQLIYYLIHSTERQGELLNCHHDQNVLVPLYQGKSVFSPLLTYGKCIVGSNL